MSLEFLLDARHRISEFAARYKLVLLLLALSFFVAGLVWSAQDLDLARISPLPLLIVLFVLGPPGIVLAAITLQQMGQIVGTTIRMRDALAVTAFGRIAELLPLPGGAIVRSAALVKSGASIKQSAGVLVWSSLLNLALACLFAGFAISFEFLSLGGTVGAISLAATLFIAAWLAKRSSGKAAVTIVVVRLATLLLGVLRFAVCFMAIEVSVPFVKTFVFVVAQALTTYVGIVPAGLGISEILSAGLAIAVSVPPSAAFLAAALNRLTGLALNGLVALYFMEAGWKKTSS